MQVYTQNNINEMLVEVDKYFANTIDFERFFWLLSNMQMPFPISKLTSNKTFGNNKSLITIIDLFHGRKPAKLYHNYKTGNYEVGFCPTLILDSQLVSYLRQYVDIKEGKQNVSMNKTLFNNVESFLRFAVENNFDYNPFFYYMESLGKDKNKNFQETSLKDAIAILKLHTMDDKKFLDTNEIFNNQELLKQYEEDYKGSNLEEIAESRSEQMIESLETRFNLNEEKLIHALLLKMTIIQKSFSLKGKKKDIIGKLMALREFMEIDLNVFLTLEYYISIFYFLNITGTFIPYIQPNTNIEKAFEKFMATTWDILLLRIPATHLKIPSDYTTLGFIATADTSYAKIASQFVLGGIIPLPHNNKLDTDVMLYKKELILEKMDESNIKKFEQYNSEKSEYRYIGKLYNQTTGKTEKRLSLLDLDKLIEKLKNEFIFLCGKQSA